MPHPRSVKWCANILSADSCNTFFANKRTSGEDFRTSHIPPFIIDLAPTSFLVVACFDAFTAGSNKWQEPRQVWWMQQIKYTMVCWLSLHIEMLSMRHHPLELFWEMAHHAAQKWIAFCHYQHCGSDLVLHVSQCVHVFGGVGRGRQTVCLHVCVCVGHCTVNWKTFASIWKCSSTHNSDILHKIFGSVFIPFVMFYPIVQFSLSIALGRAWVQE